MAGQRIDDHKSIGTPGGKGEVFKRGVHTKDYSSAEGAGHLGKYEDTTEAIKSQQEMNDRKVKSHPQKPGHRY